LAKFTPFTALLEAHNKLRQWHRLVKNAGILSLLISGIIHKFGYIGCHNSITPYTNGDNGILAIAILSLLGPRIPERGNTTGTKKHVVNDHHRMIVDDVFFFAINQMEIFKR
jgi:hypothetical protein